MGNPLRFILSPGQASDNTEAEALIAHLPALADPNDRDNDLLQRCATLHEMAARAFDAEPVDRIRDENIQVTAEPESSRPEAESPSRPL